MWARRLLRFSLVYPSSGPGLVWPLPRLDQSKSAPNWTRLSRSSLFYNREESRPLEFRAGLFSWTPATLFGLLIPMASVGHSHSAPEFTKRWLERGERPRVDRVSRLARFVVIARAQQALDQLSPGCCRLQPLVVLYWKYNSQRPRRSLIVSVNTH